MSINKVLLKAAPCALDMGDGSERGLYVNQDYLLQKMKKVHRGISLMYTYYPNDKGWPQRASVAFPQDVPSGAWNYPYEDYFPYEGGLNGNRQGEPFKFMKEIRQRGQDVVLTMTIDPELDEEHLIAVAKDLRPYGRLLLRINHECTGTWFCFSRRSTYENVAAFFVKCCKVFHKYAPNVKLILCAGMYDEASGKIEMEDIFLEAFKECDIWSGDQYLALHWGWPVDVAKKGGNSFACYDCDKVYEKAKATLHRLREITGQDKPMVLSELNADGDVTGPYGQAEIMEHFMQRLIEDDEKWLSAFTMYQFRDDGRLGLEITDPNNSDVGIEQPLLAAYRNMFHKDFFSQKIENAGSVELPAKLRWSNSEDAEGVQIPLHLEKNPHFAEVYFDKDLVDLNLILQLGSYTFYKAPGVKCVDLMSYFFDNPVKDSVDMNLNIFAPPADGLNHPENGKPGEDSPDGDWLYNSYTVLPKLPEIRIETEPVQMIKNW